MDDLKEAVYNVEVKSTIRHSMSKVKKFIRSIEKNEAVTAALVEELHQTLKLIEDALEKIGNDNETTRKN